MRNPTLDVLRAYAVLLVFARHCPELILIAHLGWAGVDLFFVLSGFLVSGLLFREYQQTRQIRPGLFLLRRGFKIYPQFYLFIAATLGLRVLSHQALPPQAVAADAAFFQNYVPGLWEHTWSLAVEEHFYLLLTIAIALLARRGGENPFAQLPRWISVFCALILGARVATWYFNPEVSIYAHQYPSHLRMDSLLAGVLLAYFHVFQSDSLTAWTRRVGPWLPQASILLLSPIAFLSNTHPFIYTVGFSMVSAGFALLLTMVLYPVKPLKPLGRAGRALARLGQVSYAFYLWHGLVLSFGKGLLPHVEVGEMSVLSYAEIAISFAATLILAFATTWLIEQPLLRMRDRWLPSRAKSPLILPRLAHSPLLTPSRDCEGAVLNTSAVTDQPV